MTPHMEVEVLEIAGVRPALLGLGLSYGRVDHIADVGKMLGVSCRLAGKNGGHDKFLESIMLWLDVNAPRYWWSQADTYRISTKQSASTMHTLRRGVSPSMFESEDHIMCGKINSMIEADMPLQEIKAALPEGFLQRRIWCMSFKTFVNIRQQRHKHKLQHWSIFIESVVEQMSESSPELHLIYTGCVEKMST